MPSGTPTPTLPSTSRHQARNHGVIASTARRTCVDIAMKSLGIAGAVLLIPWLPSFSQVRGEPARDDTPAAGSEIPARPPGTAALIERLRTTRLLNGREILDRLRLGGEDGSARRAGESLARGGGGFLTPNPFEPPYREVYASPAALRYPLPGNAGSYELNQSRGTFLFHGREPVLQWYSSLRSNTEVCAVRFVDSNRVDYHLRTFPDRESAIRKGYVITHRYHCGTCSSLRDLAVYLEKPNLTAPARTCARRLTAAGIKACLMEAVGFEEPCAETWTYNVLHTRRQCAATCIRHYGLWNVLTDNMSDEHVDEHGNLNPCLACDEDTSGPGFQYAAGRTRRTSGLTSAIYRPAPETFPVDHRCYFE